MRIVLLLIAIVALSSCGRKPLCTEVHTVVKDSTFTTVTFKPIDTIIRIPKDSVRIQTLVSELTPIPLVKNSANGLKAVVKREGDQILFDCIADSLQAEIQLLQKEIENFRSVKTQTIKTQEIPVKYVPWYTKTLAWIGGLLLGSLGLYLILKFKFL